MLSIGVIAVIISAVSAYATGGVGHLSGLLAWILVLLIAINFLGSVWLYRPIWCYLHGIPDTERSMDNRLRTLPAMAGVWIFSLTVTAMLGDVALTRGSLAVPTSLSTTAAFSTLVHCVVFAISLGFSAYLLVHNHLVTLRKYLWRQGRHLVLPRRRFALRLIFALVAVTLGPVAVAISDQWSHPTSHADGLGPLPTDIKIDSLSQFLHQSLHMDVLGSLLLSVMVAVLLARGLSRPVDILLDAMRRVDGGDLSTKAPVVSDDEFGVLTVRFNQMLEGLAERERIRRTFAYFVPESVAATLLAKEGAIEPQEREASVLFVDIEQFTRIAAALSPRAVVTLLNSYFDEIASIIHAHSGVITQFQGDAVLATFNLPTTDVDHAGHAVEAAMAIQQKVAETKFPGALRLRVRIGICSGRAVGGTVGGGERLGYTVHGDTVNLASRLEELNKQFGTRILLSARTAELLAGTLPLRDLGPVAVRGFDAPINVFEPLTSIERSRIVRSKGV